VADYRPELPEGMGSLKIDTSHADYRALEALAREEGWTQKSFSRVLGLEAKRVMAQSPKSAAAPAPAPSPSPKPAKPFSEMSDREKLTHARTTPSYRGRQ
jgi:hypothetical protein